MARNITSIILSVLLVGVIAGCGGAQHAMTDDGIPTWVDDPYVDMDPQSTICAVGVSQLVKADEEAGKTDAEISAKNRIQEQLKANIKRLQERQKTAMEEFASGEVLGSTTLKDINQNYIEENIHGLRFTDYFYAPDRLNPEKVWVRATLNIDQIAMSQSITDAMMAGLKNAALEKKLELDHQEAQLRLEKVRDQYLNEQQGGAGEASETSKAGETGQQAQ